MLLFGIPDRKDEMGSGAYDENGVIQKAVREIKERFGDDVVVITDLCLCEYTQPRPLRPQLRDGDVDNDETLKLLARGRNCPGGRPGRTSSLRPI